MKPARCAAPWIHLTALLALLLTSGCGQVAQEKKDETDRFPHEAAEEADRNIRFGIPAPSRAEPSDREAFLITRPQYTLSYNARTRTPNWVCWQLCQEDLGKSQRGAFVPDPLLPKSFAHVTSHVYDGSGFDRGHMCPAQDRSAVQADMDATFYTTNIVPQAPHCNQRGWERLEAYCRDLTKEGHVLWIASGPAGVGGEGKEGVKKEISHAGLEVTVPAKVWKVILVLPRAAARPTRGSRTIAVIMPNTQEVDYEWAQYRVNVAEVEKLTGCRFWPTLPDDLAADLKGKTDEVKVRTPKPG
jgi:endonuclease G, mitochondrial